MSKKDQGTISLPRGLGSMHWTENNTLEYKRVLTLANGTKQRKTVHGETPEDCMKKMDKLKDRLDKALPLSPDKQTLYEALLIWIEKKRPRLKEQAFNRELGTINNQIGNADIANYRYQTITSGEIQVFLNGLNEKGYSYSVIKKSYDTLNAFYRDISKRDKFDNPMDFVEVWKKANVKATEKRIEYFDEDDIIKFLLQADEKYSTGRPKYPMGNALAANIFLGLRIGELLALQWKDIDFEKNTVYIHQTLIEVPNPDYDKNNPDKMKKDKVKKVIFKIQNSTKTGNIRYVPLNSCK